MKIRSFLYLLAVAGIAATVWTLADHAASMAQDHATRQNRILHVGE